jgi:hypothetical protein
MSRRTTRSARAATAALSTVLAAGSILVGATPAHAGSPSDCPATFLCVWEHTTWGGARGQFAGTNPNWGAFSKSTGGTWNNVASSGYNHGTSGKLACMWDGTSYTLGSAGGYCLGSGVADSTFVDDGFNDVASSNNWI